LALQLKNLIDNRREEEGEWFQFPGTKFEVKIAHYGKQAMEDLYNSCKIKKTDPRNPRQIIESLDTEAFRIAYAEKIIKDWRGLTLDVLKRFIVLKQDAENSADEELPFSPDNRLALLSASAEFDNWVTNVCQDVEAFNRVKKEEQLKNSLPAHSGN
jgi:hypothetical protein